MKTFIVNMKEVWIQPVEIEAETREEAIRKVAGGEGNYLENGKVLQETLESSEWSVAGHYITADRT